MNENAPGTRFRLQRMLPRDPNEPHRVASSLELFFDLVFVIAVSTASSELHHALSEGHAASGIVSYLMIFFAIWWAWMNFTWFATSFAVDDWLYRVLTIVQMGGVVVLAAGVGPVFDEHHPDFSVVVIGYIVMRVAMIVQWLRAARGAGDGRRTTLAYAWCIAVIQALWVGFLFVPDSARLLVFVVLMLAEISVPVIAERRVQTPWHPHHITERYSLFTLIVLGESLLASAAAVIGVREEVDSLGPLIWIAIVALISAAGMWWIYFWPPHHAAISTMWRSLRYGYTHYFVFAAAAAFSAGVEVQIDALTGHTDLDPVAVSFATSIPIAVFLLGIWFVAIRENADRVVNTVVPLGAVLVLLDPLLPVPVTLTAVILVAVVVVLVLRPPVHRTVA
ncbi:low temperature requirement protein LtrA [Microbacterium sp. W4I4]|uniref:low temperature requirement protein A n=1 Tax=Microbacterium sp. W4I4 TaxID=3042295 RepID=UPI0027836DF4|nr:low temperature requirement protein A [Microbacterium sp. W4I4]MDQ0614161.1 low temperature requirement protein LtrA [Microbacterium sp. W4I4]